MLFFILLSIISFFFCLYFYFDNKKLKQKITKLEEETKIILERKLFNYKEDLVSIEKISNEPLKEITKKDTKVKEHNQISKDEFNEQSTNVTKLPKISDLKYTARTNEDEYQPIKIQSPIVTSLTNNEHKEPKQSNQLDQTKIIIKPNSISNTSVTNANLHTVSMELDFDPNEFIKKTTNKTIQAKEVKPIKEQEYLKEIAKQLEDELIPQTIALTDYEKDQEEHAVISYKELLSLKEQSKNEDKKDKTFIEDLKALRDLLSHNT